MAMNECRVDAAGNRALEGVVRLSATDGFSAYIAAPAAASVQRRHPKVAVEIVAATRRATQQRSGLDLEVVVAEPGSERNRLGARSGIRLSDRDGSLPRRRQMGRGTDRPRPEAGWRKHRRHPR